jgi:hypothetical protein
MINISLILVEKHKDIQHGSNALDWDSYIRELAQWPLVRDSSNSFDAEAAIALIQKAVESSNYAISSCFGPKGWWKRESRGMSPSSGLGKSGFLAICIVSQFGRTAPRPLVRESHASLQWFSMWDMQEMVVIFMGFYTSGRSEFTVKSSHVQVFRIRKCTCVRFELIILY